MHLFSPLAPTIQDLADFIKMKTETFSYHTIFSAILSKHPFENIVRKLANAPFSTFQKFFYSPKMQNPVHETHSILFFFLVDFFQMGRSCNFVYFLFVYFYLFIIATSYSSERCPEKTVSCLWGDSARLQDETT